MKNFSFDRSEHPLFSFVSIGKNKKIVKNIGKSAFGNDHTLAAKHYVESGFSEGRLF